MLSKMCLHSFRTLALEGRPLRPRSWSRVSIPWVPAMEDWNVSALARMAIAIREVCSPSFWCSSWAMASSVSGASAQASRSLPAAW